MAGVGAASGSGGLGGLLREGAGEGGADLDQLVQDRAVVGRVRVALGSPAGRLVVGGFGVGGRGRTSGRIGGFRGEGVKD